MQVPRHGPSHPQLHLNTASSFAAYFSGNAMLHSPETPQLTSIKGQEPQVAAEFVERSARFPPFEGFAHFICDLNVSTLREWARFTQLYFSVSLRAVS